MRKEKSNLEVLRERLFEARRDAVRAERYAQRLVEQINAIKAAEHQLNSDTPYPITSKIRRVFLTNIETRAYTAQLVAEAAQASKLSVGFMVEPMPKNFADEGYDREGCIKKGLGCIYLDYEEHFVPNCSLFWEHFNRLNKQYQ